MDKNEKGIRPRRFVVLTNLFIIIAVAIVGVAIAYLFIAIFTKHGEETVVPKVENMSYTKAVELLHSQGFNVDIRDSLFREDVKPGFVIEQFPKAKSVVKPGRKIFLYINAVHPKEVVMDDGPNRTALALKTLSYRQAKSRLSELGFKNVRTVSVLGADDRVVKVLANGRPVFQMQKVPVNAPIIIEVGDGRLSLIRDSLYESERIREYGGAIYESYESSGSGASGGSYSGSENPEENSSSETEYFETPEFFPVENEGGGD